MKTTIRILSIIITLALLAACTPAPTALPTPTASATPAPTMTLTPTVTPSPTQAGPEIDSEMQAYLDSFEAYQVVEVDGILAITVIYEGKQYRVMVEKDGGWAGVYDQMTEFRHEDGTFDVEPAAQVFTFRTVESVDEEGRQVMEINPVDYEAYQAVMAEIYAGMKPEELAQGHPHFRRRGAPDSLTGEVEVHIIFDEAANNVQAPPLRVIGSARAGEAQIATLATAAGPLTIVYMAGEGIGLSNIFDQGITMCAAQGIDQIGANTDKLYIIVKTLMASEAENPDFDYAIGNPEALAELRTWGWGWGMRVDEIEELELGSEETFDLFNQQGAPVPVYSVYIREITP